MSEKLQGFALLLPAVGGQNAVNVLLDGIVFPHTLFQASVLSVQPILFFGQTGIFLAQLGKVGGAYHRRPPLSASAPTLQRE